MRLWLGWSDSGLVDKGSYTVDEVEHSGAPDVLNIRARSADLREGLARKRERSWHGQTLGDIVRAIAVEYGLQPLVQVALAAIGLPHLDQTGESDLNLLTRLAREHDAIASIKAGRLLMLPMGKSASASGLALPHIPSPAATATSTATWRPTAMPTPAPRPTTTSWAVPSAKRRSPAATTTPRPCATPTPTAAAPARRPRRMAAPAARQRYPQLHPGQGRPDLIPELTYSLTGIKAEIAAIVWLGGNVTHNFTPDAYTTSLELTSKLPDSDELTSDQTEQHSGVLAWYRDEKTGSRNRSAPASRATPNG
ncbi:phage late control D family protein [Pseudomonas lalucatii]|nr:phage late control D family protein [Pseudomonas lalucatii]